MKKSFGLTALLLLMLYVLNLTACGKAETSANGSAFGATYMSAEDLPGTWIDNNGNMLILDVVENEYTYRTWYGRIGTGYLTGKDNNDDGRLLEFCDFYYDFMAEKDGFTLKQNGESDAENLDGFHFKSSDSDVTAIPLSELNGIWQNALGETLAIDTERMQYISCSKEQLGNGTLYDKNDGRGPYLFLNGYAYPCVSADGHSFELFTAASDTQSPDGSFSGVFYKDGKADEYADLDKKDFVEKDNRLWYFDGIWYFAVPDGYSVRDDGLAYNKDGKVFGSGWKTPIYNPADDWGESWAENWD